MRTIRARHGGRRTRLGLDRPRGGVDMDLHHWFQFTDGKISRYRGTEDSAQTEASLSA